MGKVHQQTKRGLAKKVNLARVKSGWFILTFINENDSNSLQIYELDTLKLIIITWIFLDAGYTS